MFNNIRAYKIKYIWFIYRKKLFTNSRQFKIDCEGVETIEQKEFLVENGCTNIQGYFYSKPLPIDKITKLLRDSIQT